ncbi:hypothetical protein HDU77_001288, partial [Chytriomyces hyalinus]
MHSRFILSLLSALLANCHAVRDWTDSEPTKYIHAYASLKPTAGNSATGTLWLIQDPDASPPKVELTLTIENAPVSSRHGFHVHVFGDASSTDGLSMGGHYNPFNQSHGCPDSDTMEPVAISSMHHVGDMGSIVVDEDGNAKQSWVSEQLSLIDPMSPGYVLGRGVILHADGDDCVTQPTGASGKRLSQGVIALKRSSLALTMCQDAQYPANSNDGAIAVFDTDTVSGSVAIISQDGDISIGFNLTCVPEGRTFRIGYGLAPDGASASEDDCDQAFSTFTAGSDGTLSAFKRFYEAQFPIMKLYGMTLLIMTENCVDEEFVATAPIGNLNSTAYALQIEKE